MMISTELPMAADLFGDVAPPAQQSWRACLPGLLVVAVATLAAAYLEDRYGAPLTLMALLVGLALNFLGTDQRLSPGLGIASGALLRLGIVLLGTRVTLGQIIDLGPVALIAILGIVTLTIAFAVVMARLTDVDAAFGTLAGAAVAICGASAALAVAAALGERRIGKAQLAQILVGIAAMSAMAMFLYPIGAHLIGLNDRQAGFLFGASIHDVAQAIGAGYSYSPPAGETAAIVKLTRVALLAPVLAFIALAFPNQDHRARPVGLPLFVVGFFATAAANSVNLMPPFLAHSAEVTATMLLAGAVAATGIRAPMAALKAGGIRPIIIIAAATALSLLSSVTAACWLI